MVGKRFASLLILAVGLSSPALGFSSVIPVEDERCNAPPFYTAATESPNILFVVDVSGSMGWEAYRSGHLSTYNGNEEGYFNPVLEYKYNTSDSTWYEVSGTSNRPSWSGYTLLTSPSDNTDQCPVSESGITTFRAATNGNGQYTFKGSCLNALLMDRIDVARWALTGGRPAACSSLGDANCDPTASLSSSCDATGCVLELNTSNRGDVKVPPDRIDGFIQSAEGLDTEPRMGASFYSASTLRAQKVYIGDYPDGGNADSATTRRYTYLKRYINFITPSGGTPTNPAMEEAYDYFAQHNRYGNGNPFAIHAGGWQDPMYRCTYDKTGCQASGWCTKNFVILLSDGEWNNGGDPVPPTYQMHTNLGRTFAGHAKNIDKVYTIGLFMQGQGLNAMQFMSMYGAFARTATQTWPGGTGGTGYTNHYPHTSLTRTIPASTEANRYLDWDSNPSDGVPDTYFAPQNGADLKRNLFAIFGDIVSNRGAAASVATVTQNVLGEDVVVRGAFFHDPTAAGDRLWEGHLESYWPDLDCLAAETQGACSAAGCAWADFPDQCSNYEYATETACTDAGYSWVTNRGECKPYDYENRAADQVFCDENADDNCWDAYFKLPAQSSRNIFTYINGIKVDVTTANATQLHPLLANTIDFDLDHDVDLDDTASLITWIREGSKYNWNYTVRDRSGDLGDIVYSAPLIVGAPSLGSAAKKVAMDSCQSIEPCYAHTDSTTCTLDETNSCSWNPFQEVCEPPSCSVWIDATECGSQPTCAWSNGACESKSRDAICSLPHADECFYTYQFCNSKRKKLALVAANDGMLHAFVISTWDSSNEKWLYDPADDAEIGTEAWAYIPSNLLSELTCLAAYNYGDSGGCQHRTTLDLSPKAWDITLEAVTGSCSGSSTPSSSFDNQSDCEDAGYTWACTASTDCSGLDHTDCQNAPECSSGCADGAYDCSQVTDETTCGTTPDCSWERECTGNYDCTLIPDTQTCSDAGCTWMNQTGCSWETNEFCTGWRRRCSHYSDESSCDNDWACWWRSQEECTGHFDCSQLADQTTCGNYSSLCRWNNGQSECRNRRGGSRDCDYLSSEGACNLYQGSSGCTGSAANDCSGLDDTTCGAVTDCSLQPASCVGTGTCAPGNCQTGLGCTETCEGNTTCTDYECTGTLTCSDISSQSSCTDAGCDWTAGTTEPWRTVVVGGQRGGGDLYFALDVTDPDNPSLLWEHSVLRNMVALQSTGTNSYTAIRPYTDRDVYNELVKTQPFSWSTPYVGRLDLPSDICFQAENTLLYPLSANPTSSDIKCWQEKDSGANRLSGWYAFVGGGNRMTDMDNLPVCADFTASTDCAKAAFCSWDSSSSVCNEITGIKEQLFQPYLLALDMGTGVDIFQYLWPTMQQAFAAKWPVSDIDGKNVPHSMTTPMVLDIWKGVTANDSKPLFGRDGVMDHIFVGDLAGHYWGIYMDGNPNTHTPRVYIDRWQTKKAYANCSTLTSEAACKATNACWWDAASSPSCQDGYGTRGPLQPVSAESDATFDINGNLRLYFGTGKFEQVTGDHNDRTDKGRNSFYNVTLPMAMFTQTNDSTCTATGFPQTPSINCANDNTLDLPVQSGDSLYIRLQDHSCTDCEGTADAWVNPPVNDTVKAAYVGAGCGSATGVDCGCSTECYQCIMDLTTPGEKVLGKPLVAGGLVFFTTYVPQASTCGAGGEGYVYVVDYMCRPLSRNPFADAGLAATIYYGSNGTDMSAVRASLGSGMPSDPVLDSKGEHVLIQTSDAEIKRIPVDIGARNLLKGWHEETVEE